jgi:outer membrane protein assembly factor BamB
MRKLKLLSTVAGVAAVVGFAADWPMQNGGPERNGWARSEHILSNSNIRNLRRLYTYRAENVAGDLTAPIVNGNLITYRGFKEMLIFAARPNRVFSVDADLNKTIWVRQLAVHESAGARGTGNGACPDEATGPVAMAGSSSATMHFAAEASHTLAASGPATASAPTTAGTPASSTTGAGSTAPGLSASPVFPGTTRRRPSPYFPPLWQSIYPMRPETLTQLAVVYTVSSDGYLHILNSSTGADLIAAVKFVPPHAKVTSLNIWHNMVYATTAGNCDGYRNALYAVNLLTNEKRVLVFSPEIGSFAGTAGTAIGRDGTVYVQVFQPADRTGRYREAVLALTPRELKLQDYFSPAEEKLRREDLGDAGITPMVFNWLGKEMVAAAMRDGRIYLLDAKSLGAADHHTALFTSKQIASVGRRHASAGFRGAFSTWQDVDTLQRWIYAPLHGPANPKSGVRASGEWPTAGAILAFKLSGAGGETTFAPLWISQDLASPTPAVIANSMVFTLSRGEQTALHVLDAVSGKELYVSEPIAGRVSGNGLAVANGRVYFTTDDNTAYCFGLPGANLQLAEDE